VNPIEEETIARLDEVGLSFGQYLELPPVVEEAGEADEDEA